MAPAVPVEYIGQRESIRCFKQVLGKMMGKSRKVSKTYSSGIVPDYRHNVDRMAESEAFGSCGRLDTEMTASEDSYAPKRKNINLNERDKFGVPVRVLSLSKMSSSERKKLEIKLKDELEQVRILQRRVASLNSGAMVMSPASDIHNCTNGQKRPPIASIQRPVKEASVTPGKKKNPPGKNGPRTKGLHVKRNEPVTQALQETQIMPPNANSYILMNQCQTLLNRMMAHEYGWVFNEPVDVVKLNIPDYFNVIKHPMDLGTVKRKLLSGQYLDPLGFAADVRLTFANAMTYNPQGNDVHFMAKTLGKFFEIRWKVIEKKIPTFTDDLAPKSSVKVETEAATPMQPLKKAKVTPLESIVKSENKVKEEPVKRVMADIERRKLGTELESLIGDLPDNILDFLKENCSNDSSQDGEDEIELDMDALSDDTLFTLRKLLDDHLMEQKLSKPPRETEVTTNESGFSNSFVPPQKGDEPAEEEVDIGGDDLPSSSFPPVEIQKDITTHRNSKCSSSSSSSGDSGSSSSDSDSGSSSSGESDAGKDSAPVITSKESLIPMENREQKTGVPVDDERGGTKGVLTQQNQGSSLDPAEPDYHQDDENAAPERQVSPKTLYRAAFLRSRFADTIIKAQEKTLDKGDKLDPEKLRIEREELERRRREEKARLQAEAKAAEDARRKAEEEAAAETRRKIELEREAARQALQKMEKTVDIEDNHYIEALKLFRVAPDVHLQSFGEERSPDNSQEGHGSFEFQATSNPLEQLGLYMKHDEEEEEEAEPQILPSNDPEEGEID